MEAVAGHSAHEIRTWGTRCHRRQRARYAASEHRATQEALHFQNHSWPELRAELSKKYRLLRYPGPLIARLVRVGMARRSPYRNAPGQ